MSSSIPTEVTPLAASLKDAGASEVLKSRVEQYKLYVQMADQISARRMATNSFYMAIHAALYGVMWGFMIKEFEPMSAHLKNNFEWSLLVLVSAPFCLLGMICYCWWYNIRSYDQLNSAKFEVVGLLEQHLPEQPYALEWKMLEYGKNSQKYKPVSKIERWVPLLMGVADLMTVAIVILVLLV